MSKISPVFLARGALGAQLAFGCALSLWCACVSNYEDEVGVAASALRAVSRAPLAITYAGSANGNSSACSTARELLVFEPTDAATGERFPVMIVTVGLNAPHTEIDALTIAREGAKRGYVAASMEFANDSSGLSCSGVDQRANCSYNARLSDSAVSRLCSRPLADCARGVVTFGHSLGGAMAVRAKNFDDRVRAAVTIGTANGNNGAACFDPGQADGGNTDRALRNHEWRLYAGETEFAENNATTRNTVTGQRCAAAPGTIDCLRDDGSGWYQVGNSEVGDQVADHCYQLTGNGSLAAIPTVQSCAANAVDTTFESGTRPWSLGPAFAFLSSRTR
jgi:dienelactone hydrolase